MFLSFFFTSICVSTSLSLPVYFSLSLPGFLYNLGSLDDSEAHLSLPLLGRRASGNVISRRLHLCETGLSCATTAYFSLLPSVCVCV